MKRIFNKKQELEICRLYWQRFNCYELAKMFKCNSNTIYNILKRNNTKIRTVSEAKKKYSCNENYFDTINTFEKEQILGLLLSDGTVDKNKKYFSFISTDKEICEFLKKEFGYNGSIYFCKRENRKNSYSIKISSKKLCQKLIDFGIIPNKSFNTSFNFRFDLLSENKNNSGIILGIFDGDGCIHSNKETNLYFSISSSSYSFLEKYQDILIKNCNLNKTKIRKKQNSNCYELRYGGNKQCYRIYKFMYENSEFCLERKRKVFEDIFKLNPKSYILVK